jgi:hypothetical protein
VQLATDSNDSNEESEVDDESMTVSSQHLTHFFNFDPSKCYLNSFYGLISSASLNSQFSEEYDKRWITSYKNLVQ